MLSIIFLSITILFLLKIILFSKNKPELLLLVPFTISTNFFGFLPYSFFSTEGIIQQDDIVFIIILIINLFFYLNYKTLHSRNRFLITYRRILIIFISFIIFNLFLSTILYGNFFSSFKVFRIFFRYVSILSFLSILTRLEWDRVKNLLQYIDIITIILATLYVLNYGFNIPIFAVRSYQEDVFYGTLIYRNFFAFPIFLFFVLTRMLLSEKLNVYKIISVAILVANVLLVYTRTLLIVAIVIILVSLIVRYKLFDVKFNIPKLAIAIAALVLIGILMTNVIFPNQFYYFKTRMDEIVFVGSIYEVNNFELRTNIISSRLEKTLQVNPVFGLGFMRDDVSPKYYADLFIRSGDKTGSILIGDQSWGSFIASMGFGGAVIFLSLILYPIFVWFKNKRNKIAPVFFMVVIPLLCEIFIVGYISTNLTDEIFKISFMISLLSYIVLISDNRGKALYGK